MQILYWLVALAGSIRGALEDPLIWILIIAVGAIGFFKRAVWWAPAIVAALFNATHILNNAPWWTKIGIAWQDKVIWQYVVKLVIAYVVFAAVRFVRWTSQSPPSHSKVSD